MNNKGVTLPPCRVCNGRIQWFRKSGSTIVYQCMECQKLWSRDSYENWTEVEPSNRVTANICPVCQLEGYKTSQGDRGQVYKCPNGHRFVKKGGVIQEYNPARQPHREAGLSGWQLQNQATKRPDSWKVLARSYLNEAGFRARNKEERISFKDWLKQETITDWTLQEEGELE